MKRLNANSLYFPLAFVLAAMIGCNVSLSNPHALTDGDTLQRTPTRGMVSVNNWLSITGESLSSPTASVRIASKLDYRQALFDDANQSSPADGYKVGFKDESSSAGENSNDWTEVEIDGVVTRIDSATGTLYIEGIEIRTSNVTKYLYRGDYYVSREEFFGSLRQGVTVVKVRWHPFTGYDQPAQKLELES